MTTKDGIYLIIDGDEWEIVTGAEEMGVYLEHHDPIEDPQDEFCIVLPLYRLIVTSTAFSDLNLGTALLKAIEISRTDQCRRKLEERHNEAKSHARAEKGNGAR